MIKKKSTPTMAQKSSNSRAEAMSAAMSGAKMVTNNTKKEKNTMATKKASAKKMMAKPAKPAAKDSGMTAAQKKLPAFIQKSIMSKKGSKKK